MSVQFEDQREALTPAAPAVRRGGFGPGVRHLTCSASGSVATLVGLAAFLVYWRTLAPSIVWGDSPELTAAAFTAGVPHPTGYPLYMLLAHAFLRLCPGGSIASRMNLLSALSAALAVALLYPVMRRVTGARLPSLVATLLFAFSQMFWSQAVIAEVYAFQMLGMAALLGCLLTWDARGERRWLSATALVYGLCCTHHGMSALLAPGLLFFALTSRHRPQFVRELPRTLPLFLLPLCLYAYLPLAALRNPPLNWGDPHNWRNLVEHVTGQQYHRLMFRLTRAKLLAHVQDYLGLGKGSTGFLPAQFSPGLLGLAPLGAWSLARRHWRLFGLTLLVYLTDVVFALNYFVFDVDVYYLPSHLMVALWIGCGLRQGGVWLGLLWRRMAVAPARRRSLNGICGAALLILPTALLWVHWRENDHHDDWSALMYARAVLATLKPHAVLVGEGDDNYFPLLYPRFVENERPDVTLIEGSNALYPPRLRLVTRLRTEGLKVRVPDCFLHGHERGRFHSCLLKQLLADNVGHRPTYLLAPPDWVEQWWPARAIAPYYQIADSNMSRVELTRRLPRLAVAQPRPQRGKPVWFGPLQSNGRVGNDVELLGYDVEPYDEAGVPLVRMSYYWRLRHPLAARPLTVWVLFTDAAGNYRREEDGAPEFHNIHPLAYGLGREKQPLPPTLRETFTLYVPPGERNQRLHVRVAVALHGKFLSAGTDRTAWVEIGELPSISGGEKPYRLASAGALGRRD